MSIFQDYSERMGKLIGTIGDPLQQIFAAAGNALGGIATAVGLGVDGAATRIADRGKQNNRAQVSDSAPDPELQPMTRQISSNDIAPPQREQYDKILAQNNMGRTGNLQASQVVNDAALDPSKDNAYRTSGPAVQRGQDQQAVNYA